MIKLDFYLKTHHFQESSLHEGDLLFFAEETTKKLQVQSLEYQTSRNKKTITEKTTKYKTSGFLQLSQKYLKHYIYNFNIYFNNHKYLTEYF